MDKTIKCVVKQIHTYTTTLAGCRIYKAGTVSYHHENIPQYTWGLNTRNLKPIILRQKTNIQINAIEKLEKSVYSTTTAGRIYGSEDTEKLTSSDQSNFVESTLIKSYCT